MLLPSAWYSTLPPLGAESPSVTRPSGRSPPGATVMLAASVEPPRPDLASLVADFCVPSPSLLCAPRHRRVKGGLPMGALRRSSRIAAASKGRGPNPVTAGQNNARGLGGAALVGRVLHYSPTPTPVFCGSGGCAYRPSLVPLIRSLADDPMLLEAGLRAAPRGVSTRPVPLTTVFDRIRSPPPPSSTRGQVAPLPP
jgi:hypothetical protein